MPNRLNNMIEVAHTDTILRTFILFVQTAYVVLKYADAYLYKKTRLSVIKLIVLQVLNANGGTMTPSEIAEWTLRERHNITTLLRRMAKDELIRTESNNRDMRSFNVILTDKGREVISQAIPVAKTIVNQVMLSISEDDASVLEQTLRTLRQNGHRSLQLLTRRSQL